MNKKFFTRLGALFLVLISIGFSETFFSLLAMDSKEEGSLDIVPQKLLHLNRVDDDNEILLEYTDNLKLAGSNFIYNLKFPIDDELTSKVCQYGNQDDKSHVLVNSFDIYENKKKKFIEYEHLTTKAFHQVGIGANNTDIQIDWMSYQSSLQSTNEVIHRKSAGTGNGHSEPQFIKDIEDLFQKSSDDVVNFFIPQPNELKNSKVHMCGLELYGYHDICDSCLNKLVAFREKHQEGEESISKAIEAKLKDKYSIHPEIVLHSFIIPLNLMQALQTLQATIIPNRKDNTI